MWAQLIKARLKPGHEAELELLHHHLQAAEQPDSGLVRSTTMRDQNDSNTVYTLVVFESEEKARARERDPRREEGLREARAVMADAFEGPPEFTNLTVVIDYTR
jgi:antibiotic biosynthesis monooxygenase (ABM) superfamily enzyme